MTKPPYKIVILCVAMVLPNNNSAAKKLVWGSCNNYIISKNGIYRELL